MGNEDFLQEVADLESKFDHSSPLLAEIIFFKIFVKFEIYLSEIFSAYCIGESSSKGYLPQRKLNFIDRDHLNGVIKKQNNDFNDNLSTIERLSKHVFNDNPFSCILETQFTTHIRNMQTIRNHVAHESSYSKNKYREACLSGISDFLSPGEFLLRINRRTHRTNYSDYVEMIKDISDLVLEPLTT